MQFFQPLWIPWCFNALASPTRPGSAWIYWYIRLPGWWFLSWNMPADDEDRPVWALGKLLLTRPETEQEREEREDGVAEAWAEEVERNRYTEWYY